MKLERAKKLDVALEQLVKDSEQLIAYANHMRGKIGSVIDWDLPEKETLEYVWVKKWQIKRYSSAVKYMAESIIINY